MAFSLENIFINSALITHKLVNMHPLKIHFTNALKLEIDIPLLTKIIYFNLF